jgi:hypothetical protein
MNSKSPYPPDENKPYRIEFEHRPEYLYAYVSGEHDSLAISLAFWREIADECRRVQTKKLLVEEEIEEAVSMVEMYKIASEIAQIGFRNISIAFVDRFLEQRDINEFGEMVATNRGIHGKYFNDFNEAEKWLLEN